MALLSDYGRHILACTCTCADRYAVTVIMYVPQETLSESKRNNAALHLQAISRQKDGRLLLVQSPRFVTTLASVLQRTGSFVNVVPVMTNLAFSIASGEIDSDVLLDTQVTARIARMCMMCRHEQGQAQPQDSHACCLGMHTRTHAHTYCCCKPAAPPPAGSERRLTTH